MPKLKSLGARLNTLDTRRTAVLEAYPDATPRLRGRAGQERRERWLKLHPVCWACQRKGRATAGDVVDHRHPLWAGGKDDESNFGTLCQKPHHDAKTACESAMRARGAFDLTRCTCGLHTQAPDPEQSTACKYSFA